MTEMERNYEIQGALDDLDLLGHNVFDVLDYLQKFKHLYRIEWATRAPRVIETFDRHRIRVWYRDGTEEVFAVVHG